MSPRRTPRAERGALGEDLAAGWLRSRGYRIAGRNLRTRHAEIDILARRRRLWLAVEVKTGSWATSAPERSFTEHQRDRLQRALCALAGTLTPAPRHLRVDLVAVRVHPEAGWEILHFPGRLLS